MKRYYYETEHSLSPRHLLAETDEEAIEKARTSNAIVLYVDTDNGFHIVWSEDPRA